MRTYDYHRGLMTLLGAGTAGLLVWIATQVGQQSTGRFWAAMAIIAGAGLVLAASQLVGGWTKWGMPRLSVGVFLVGFLPVLICVGWVLMATQPGNGWQEGRLRSWSESLGIFGGVRELGLYHGVFAFAFGLALGFCFDTAGLRRREPVRDEVLVPVHTTPNDYVAPAPAPADRVADEPVTAEREELATAVPAGPSRRERMLARFGRTSSPEA